MAKVSGSKNGVGLEVKIEFTCFHYKFDINRIIHPDTHICVQLVLYTVPLVLSCSLCVQARPEGGSGSGLKRVRTYCRQILLFKKHHSTLTLAPPNIPYRAPPSMRMLILEINNYNNHVISEAAS